MAQFSHPNNAMLIVCTPVFNLLARIQQDKLPASIALYPDFVQAFHSLERLAQTHFISHEDLVHIKACLAMFVDDNMQYDQFLRPISAALPWPKSHLQLTLLGYNYAEIEKYGENGFVEHLEKLLKNGKQHLSLIELYYVCLALGFKGETMENVPLLRLKVRVHQEIIRIRGPASRLLSLDCQQERIALTKPAKPFSLFVLLICAAILFGLGVFVIEYILRIEILSHYYYIKEQAQLLISVVSEGRQ